MNIKDKCNELKDLVSQFQTKSFVLNFCYLSNLHIRAGNNLYGLTSPVRQLQYLIALHLSSTTPKKVKTYHILEDYHQRIIDLLNEIEHHYSSLDEIRTGGLSDQEKEKVMISKLTFLNYYLNAPLSYLEQDIDRITNTFSPFNEFVENSTGLQVQDFLDIQRLLTNQEIDRCNNYQRRTNTPENLKLIQKVQIDGPKKHIKALTDMADALDDAIISLAIPIAGLGEVVKIEKIYAFIRLFSCFRSNTVSDYLYYTDECLLIKKPILMVDEHSIAMVYSKQLLNAMYDYLFEICKTMDGNDRKIFEQRENLLESKTVEIFTDFLGLDAVCHTNYYINNSEKDILIMKKGMALIIECKANRFREPMRDPVKGFDRIRDDFKKSILKGHEQSNEVLELFRAGKEFVITDNRKKVLMNINPKSFKHVFAIVVTQERFGQIQCNLGDLLQLKEGEEYPWSVCIDDLETFLITLKRKENHFGDFAAFLRNRQKLNGHLFCSDELELCAYVGISSKLATRSAFKLTPHFAAN